MAPPGMEPAERASGSLGPAREAEAHASRKRRKAENKRKRDNTSSVVRNKVTEKFVRKLKYRDEGQGNPKME